MRGIECALCGFLARDAEARTTKTGKPMAILNVGVTDGGESESEGNAGDITWAKVLVFNERAEAVQGLTKGARIYVEGQLKLDRWTAADGAERSSLTVLAQLVQPLGQIGKRRPQGSGARGDRARRLPTPEERTRVASWQGVAPNADPGFIPAAPDPAGFDDLDDRILF